MKFVEPAVILVSATPEPEKLIERMGRICYKSEDSITADSAPKFIAMLMKRGHESVIEHAFASIIVTTDRGITHEQVRHRLASYSQESTRYCNYNKGAFDGEISLIPPLGIDGDDLDDLLEVGRLCEEKYKKWISKGRTPQQARDLLPTCLKADIGMTANFREWRHFLRLRTSSSQRIADERARQNAKEGTCADCSCNLRVGGDDPVRAPFCTACFDRRIVEMREFAREYWERTEIDRLLRKRAAT